MYVLSFSFTCVLIIYPVIILYIVVVSAYCDEYGAPKGTFLRCERSLRSLSEANDSSG